MVLLVSHLLTSSYLTIDTTYVVSMFYDRVEPFENRPCILGLSASCKQCKLGTKVKVDLTLGTNFMNTDIVITASFDYYE